MDIKLCDIGQNDQAVMMSNVEDNHLTIFYLLDDRAIIDIDDGKSIKTITLSLEAFKTLHSKLALALEKKAIIEETTPNSRNSKKTFFVSP